MDETESRIQWFATHIADPYTECRSYPADISLPFEVKPEEFLSAAQRYLATRKKIEQMDALSNAKRALDLRIDQLLFLFGLDGLAKRHKWSIPKKLDVLAYLSLPAPRLLKKLNSFRNAMEHDFKMPGLTALEDFVDGVTLFLESTWWYIDGFADHAVFTNEDCDWYCLDVTLNRDARKITVRTLNSRQLESGTELEMDETVDVPVQHPWYLPLLGAYIASLFGRQWLVDSEGKYQNLPDDQP